MSMYNPFDPNKSGVQRMIDRSMPQDKMEARVFSVPPTGTQIYCTPTSGGRGPIPVLVEPGSKYVVGQTVMLARSSVSKRWTVSSTYVNGSTASNAAPSQTNSTADPGVGVALSAPTISGVSLPGAILIQITTNDMLVYQYQLTLFDGTTTTLKTFVGDSYYFPTKVPMTVWVRSFNSGGITSADSAHITLSPLYGTSGASFESWGGTFTLPASATTNLATLIGSYGSFTHIDEIELFTDAPSFLSSSGVTATLGGLTLISSGDYDVKLDKNQSFDVSLENGGSLSSPAPLVFAGTITNSDTSAHTIGLLLKGTT